MQETQSDQNILSDRNYYKKINIKIPLKFSYITEQIKLYFSISFVTKLESKI